MLRGVGYAQAGQLRESFDAVFALAEMMKEGDTVAVANGLSDARVTGIQPVVECMVHGRASFWQKQLFFFV
jgi:hypothetical protein